MKKLHKVNGVIARYVNPSNKVAGEVQDSLNSTAEVGSNGAVSGTIGQNPYIQAIWGYILGNIDDQSDLISRLQLVKDYAQGIVGDEARQRIINDETLQQSIDSESSSRVAADQILRTIISQLDLKIDSEITRAISVEGNLDSLTTQEKRTLVKAINEINSNISSFSTRLDAEVSRATQAESVLQGNIASESVVRLNSDNQLQLNIDSEVLVRSNADSLLQIGITNESNARGLADTSLQSNIDSETYLREYNDNQLSNSINQEIIARTESATALQNSISNEVLARSSADTGLQSNITSEASTRSLVDMGLQDQINNLKAIGRFLSIWNCVTGLPTTNPVEYDSEGRYYYHTGDYYIIGTVGQTNYKPNGQYYEIDVPSHTTETGEAAVSDYYVYDSVNWRLLSNTQKTLSFVNITGDPYDNTELSTALNNKITKNSDILGGTSTKITYDSKGLVTSGSSLSSSDIPGLDASKITSGKFPDSRISSASTWTGKQDRLTAGTGIAITIDSEGNNIISNTQTSAEWGNITGTLSNQTDLQLELNNKQATLIGTQIEGQNIKTVNNVTVLGTGNIVTDNAAWGNITGTLASQSDLNTALSGKQATLISGTNIKTINNESILNSGNISVQPTLVSGTNIKTINNNSLLGSGDIDVQPTLVSGTNIKTINNISLLGSENISVQPTLVSGTNIKTINGSSILTSGNIVASDVSVSQSGSSTTEVEYITVNNTEYKLFGGNIWYDESYTITKTLTNCTGDIPSDIFPGDVINTTIIASTGYVLPESIVVVNATSTWNYSTGELSISNATGNVTITITGETPWDTNPMTSSEATAAGLTWGMEV